MTIREKLCAGMALCIVLSCLGIAQDADSTVTRATVRGAAGLIGLRFSDAKIDSMIDGLKDQAKNYRSLRLTPLANSVPPALLFNPLPVGFTVKGKKHPFVASRQKTIAVPATDEELAFTPVTGLAELLRTRRVTSAALTRLFLDRLKKYGPGLECVITLAEDSAMEQARRADREIAAGRYRGPLHGIPYGAKDLLAARGMRTTWGSVPFKEQVIRENATVITRLAEAGAILVAKLTMGELAWGDVWFGGMTRNPWNRQEGSSGSSAGSASATAAGLVPFAIGTETYGSIVSPSTRCGTTGLRPTYGRVSRAGAMALSWSMDKIGPICRTVEDCAIVFNAIVGPDGIDQSLIDAPFNYAPLTSLKGLRIGYVKADFDSAVSEKKQSDDVFAALRQLGATMVPIELPRYPLEDMSIILTAEAGAAFDELTRDGRDDLLVRQIKNSWPNVFRLSRLIPAVEYIQANRLRFKLVQDMHRVVSSVDAYIAPSLVGDNLLLTNLTGHPCVVLPNGFNDAGSPTSITFTGRLFDEGRLLAIAKAYQDSRTYHLKHPRLEP
jgi:Asp-tRNA(Asn)/Glu-tRNA(Gln) amidotransferase A subunit family amidase